MRTSPMEPFARATSTVVLGSLGTRGDDIHPRIVAGALAAATALTRSFGQAPLRALPPQDRRKKHLFLMDESEVQLIPWAYRRLPQKRRTTRARVVLRFRAYPTVKKVPSILIARRIKSRPTGKRVEVTGKRNVTSGRRSGRILGRALMMP